MTYRDPDEAAVAREAHRRVQRVSCFFQAVFALSIVALIAIDLTPSRPRLDCHKVEAQVMSHYPHPYGEPPPVTWSACKWVRD